MLMGESVTVWEWYPQFSAPTETPPTVRAMRTSVWAQKALVEIFFLLFKWFEIIYNSIKYKQILKM